jgi:hypothetical protein
VTQEPASIEGHIRHFVHGQIERLEAIAVALEGKIEMATKADIDAVRDSLNAAIAAVNTEVTTLIANAAGGLTAAESDAVLADQQATLAAVQAISPAP